MRKARWLAVLGDIGYDIAMAADVRILNAVRQSFGTHTGLCPLT